MHEDWKTTELRAAEQGALARTQALGETAFKSVLQAGRPVALAVLVQSAEDVVATAAFCAKLAGPAVRVLLRYSAMKRIFGEQKADDVRAASMSTCADRICVFDDAEIPFDPTWSVAIVPYAAPERPGSRFVHWCASHRLIVTLASCSKGIVSKNIIISFNDFSADAAALFPAFPLTSAESRVLLSDLFVMFGDETSGEWAVGLPSGPLPAPAPDTAVRLAEPQVATREQKRRAAGPDAFDAIRRAAKRIAMSSVAPSAPALPAPAPSAPTPPLEHLIIWQ
jgi:hypothetical protein